MKPVQVKLIIILQDVLRIKPRIFFQTYNILSSIGALTPDAPQHVGTVENTATTEDSGFYETCTVTITSFIDIRGSTI